jgi:hypothetical protein
MGSYPVKTKGDSSVFSVIQSPVQLHSSCTKYDHTNQESLCVLYVIGAILFSGVLMSKLIVIKVAVSLQEASCIEGS